MCKNSVFNILYVYNFIVCQNCDMFKDKVNTNDEFKSPIF
jgi:hypothetical protein